MGRRNKTLDRFYFIFFFVWFGWLQYLMLRWSGLTYEPRKIRLAWHSCVDHEPCSPHFWNERNNKKNLLISGIKYFIFYFFHVEIICNLCYSFMMSLMMTKGRMRGGGGDCLPERRQHFNINFYWLTMFLHLCTNVWYQPHKNHHPTIKPLATWTKRNVQFFQWSVKKSHWSCLNGWLKGLFVLTFFPLIIVDA